MRRFIFKNFLLSLIIISIVVIFKIKLDSNFRIVESGSTEAAIAKQTNLETTNESSVAIVNNISKATDKSNAIPAVPKSSDEKATITSRSKKVQNSELPVFSESDVKEPKVFEYENYELINGQKMKFALYTPEIITENMPVIVYMHGSGECGADFTKYKTNVALYRNLCEEKISVNAIIIFPIAPDGIFRTDNAQRLKTEYRANVLSLLEELNSGNFIDKDGRKISTDKNKNALMGFSMGAGIALGYSKEDVQKFNTYVFMSAFDVYSAKNYTEANSIMTIVGTNDQPGAKEGTADLNKLFAAAGTNYTTKEYEASHSTIQGTVFADSNLLEWILEQMETNQSIEYED